MFAQVANYTFSQSSGTYTPISGGTVSASGSGLDDSIISVTLPTAFSYNGNNITTVGFSPNGYLIMGNTTSHGYTPISSTATSNGVIAGLGMDLVANSASSELRWQQIGNEIIFQWTDFKRYNSPAFTNESFSMQIRLNTTTKGISVVYNGSASINVSTTRIPQVGLRGSSNTDYNARRLTTSVPDTTPSWDDTTAATSNAHNVRFTSTAPATFPTAGLTFSWAAPVIAIDMAATAITGIPSSNCANISVPVSVTITNNGANTIDFSTNNATVTLNVTGASTQTLTATLNSGTLATSGSQSVLLSPNANFSVAGTHNLSATVTVAGDAVAANNTTTGSKVIAASIASPYNMDFPTTSSPTGWNTTGWLIGASGHSVTTNGVYKNMWNNSGSTSGQFNTIAVGPLGSNDELKFDFRILNWSSTYPGTQVPPTGNWGNFKVQISTDCGGTYSDLQQIDNSNHLVTDQSWTTKVYNLASYSGQNVVVRILATWSSGDYFLDFDNFSIAPVPVLPPNCATGLLPADLTTDFDRNGSLTWSAATGGPTSYDVYFGTSSNPSLVTNTTGLSYTPSTMLANTTYYWKIVPKNDNGDATGCIEQSFTTATNFTYCAVSTTNTSDYTSAFSTTNAVANLSYTATSQPSGSYSDQTAQNFTVYQGETFDFSHSYVGGGNGVKIWIDYDENGLFDVAEEVFYLANSSATKTGSVTVSLITPVGQYRMRVRSQYGSSAVPPACGNVSYGSTVDYTLSVASAPTDTPDYVNLQYPDNATILAGDSVTVYARVYEGGLTDTTSGQASGIEAWIGISPEGADASSNPNTWTTWIPATFNVETDGNNNDEYQASIGSTLLAGTYRYASRFRLNGGPYVYGGYPFNAWNGSDSNSGILTVNPNPTQCAGIDTPANASSDVAIGTVTLSWTAPLSGPAPTGYKVFFGTTSGSLTQAGTTTNLTYNVSAPAYSTTYYWQIVPTSVIGDGDALGCAEWSFTTQADPFAPYCSAITFTSNVEPITSVNFAGINNQSSATLNGTPALQNFIALSGNVTSGESYTMTLKGNTDGDYVNNFRVFIDWNQDGDFNDAGETYNAGTIEDSDGLDAVEAVSTIAVPSNALPGTTRMRVKKIYATTNIDNPCVGSGFGQVEDYSLNVSIPWYLDADNDSYGDDNNVIVAVENPLPGLFVSVGGDCDDTNNTVYPGATEICYDGLDNDCDGTIDNGCTPIVSVVQPAQCGQTLATIDSYVYANLVAGAQGYRFRVTDMTTNEVQSIDRALRVFRLTQLTNYAFNRTYTVEVSVRINNVWQPFYGTPCNVSTPDTTTQVQASQCNTVISNVNNAIFADIVPFATGYRFRVTNTLNPIDVQTIDRPIRDFRMNLLSNIQFNTTYNVEVAVRNTDGEYLSYGPVCNITTPLFPTVGLEDAQCDEYMVTSNTEVLYAESYPGVEQYRFLLENVSLAYSQAVDRATRTFSLSNFTGLLPGEMYTVRVAIRLNGVWGPYGKSCSVIAPGGEIIVIRPGDSMGGTEFKAIAYPNPFETSFTIDVRTSNTEAVSLTVYDMAGRLLEVKEVKAQDVTNYQFGEGYPSGVYNLVVTQGNETRTVRVVKQ